MNEYKLEKRSGWIGGLILITIGAALFLAQFVDFDNTLLAQFDGVLLIPLIGGVFLVAGILTRNAGFLIPGGIISGIGWGATFVTGTVTLPFFAEWNEGAIFMLTFAAGWALITLLTAIFSDETHWWALIPSAIMALIGLTVQFGGAFETILMTVGKLWPLLLVFGGIAIIADQVKNRNKTPDEKLLD